MASFCGGGGGDAVNVDCGTGVVGGPASAFLSGTDGYVDFVGEVDVGVTSPAVLAGDVAVGVASPAVAGAASLTDLAGDVTIGVASPAVAGAASLADIAGDVAVRKASPAVVVDFVEVVAVEVTPSAVAGVASMADASLADAVVESLADLAGSVAGRVTDLTIPV